MKIAKNYRIDEQLIKDMIEVAKLENRSETNLIETVMKKYCEEQLRSNKKESLKSRKR